MTAKPIKGFEDYSITTNGKVISYKMGYAVELSLGTDKDGYFRCTLYRDGNPYYFRINRLVAITFIPNPDNLPFVNHKNGDKGDNELSNLEWTTPQGNNDHAKVMGLHSMNIPIVQKDLEGNILDYFYSTRDAQLKTKVDGSTISKVCKGIRKSAGGFRWEFA